MGLRSRNRYQPSSRPGRNTGLTLYCDRHSLESQWVALALLEKQIDGAQIRWMEAGEFSEDLLTLNPSGSLPTIADRELVIHPAGVIAEFVDERYPHPPLLPMDPADRARLRMVLDGLVRDVFPAFQKEPLTAQRTRDLRQIARFIVPGRPWFLGMDHSLVDCACAVLLASVAARNGEWLDVVPELNRYAKRCFDRPAFMDLMHEAGSAAFA